MIYTIGYGMDSSKNCPTKSANSNETTAWAGLPGATLLAKMATDPSKFFNAPASSAVADAFKSAAEDLSGAGLKLVQATLPPIVTSVSPSHGPLVGGNVVAISGQFFTAATAVTFGGIGSTFTVNSDTSITAIAPTRSNGIVDVMVTTPGGPSTLTSADRYTYP